VTIMWWGGEDENPPSGGSSSENTTPPVDLVAEDALREATASPTASTSMSEDVAELHDLRDQFAMQESLLGQLKTVLKSNEDKLHVKEKEVQVAEQE
jgi:hypothetical protein